MKRIKAAVVGLGYWGPNLARNLQASADWELTGLCDRDDKRLARLAESYPGARAHASLEELLATNKPELVAIATPVGAHFALAKQALLAGCHVLCEKPLASTTAEATELCAIAAEKKLSVFVDHTFAYTGGVRAIRDMYKAGELGDLFYIDSVRINLGLFQPDVDVIWDLAPHDLSILGYVLDQRVKSVQATGSSHNPRELSDVAYLTLTYESGVTAHLHLSWLSPVKVRRMIFSGTKSSILFDDLEMSEKIKIYEHGVSFDVSDLEARKQVLVNYRRGDMRAPAIDNKEALGVEMKEIAEALRGNTTRQIPRGEDGLEVVRILEAASASLAADGVRITI
jgi:predicted dehydrogenase